MRLIAAAVVASVVGAMLGVPAAGQVASTAPIPVEAAVPVAPDADAAAVTARRSGQRVEVASARTELTSVFANPSGGFTSESAAVPQRVKRTDGSWAVVDLALRRGSDGWRPAASVADVRFSDGGRGAAVTLVRRGKALSLSWPGNLPKPSVSGDAATYPEVLPGVDLVLRATRTGFTHVFVVKSAQAAANPALRELRFKLGGDARVVRGPEGRLSAVVGTDLIATAEPAVMWDSTDGRAGAPTRLGAADEPLAGSTVTPSSSAAPGDRAKTAAVGTELAGGDLVLRPDAKLLAADAVFPVYIDPAWSTGKSRWAYATADNSNNTDTAVARVGRDPDSGKLYRSFFDFPLAALRGKHIESAYVQMKLDHSWSCTDTPTYMYHSGGIASTPRTKWSPKLNSLKSSANSHANEGYGCEDSPQEDMPVNFIGSAVTNLIQLQATSNATNITFAFCACSATGGSGESTTDRWKKFFPNNAKLVVDFDNMPGQPHSLQAGGVACPVGAAITLGALDPTFSAIFPDADRTQALTTAYEWVVVPRSGAIDATTPRRTPPAGASVPANQRSTTAPLPGLVEGTTYAFRAKATDPAPYSQTSAWSGWCQFKVDTQVPVVGASLVNPTAPVLPGSVVTFQLRAADATVTTFRYGWDGKSTAEAPKTGTACVPRPPAPPSCTAVATVSLTVPRYGLNILRVSAADGAGNAGFGSEEFTAGRPTPAIARWGLETYPGVTATQALEDGQPSLGGDSPLSGNASWAGDVRVVRGQAASFNGTSSALSTATKVVDTTRSFSVAGWVRLGSLPTTDMVVASQEGANTAGFHLGTRLEGSPPTPRWSFMMKDSDLQSSTTRAAVSGSALTSGDVGRWTHLAGVYDQTAGKVRLYVNGSPVGEVDRTAAPWGANGKFTLGRGWNAGAPGSWFNGGLADVQVYDRAVIEHDFTGQLKGDPMSGEYDEPGMLGAIKVGDWDFSGAQRCYEESTDPTLCSAPETGQFGRRLALTQGSDVGSGHRDEGLTFDAVHFTEDPTDPYFGLATREYGLSQDNVGASQNPTWQHGPVLRTAQSFSVSVWVRPSELGGTQSAVSQLGTKQSAFYLGHREEVVNGVAENRWSFGVSGADSDAPANKYASMQSRLLNAEDDLSRWTHLVGVYDVARRQVRLYVNGALGAEVAFGSGSFSGAFDATGPLAVGGARFTPVGGATVMTNRWRGDLDDLGLFQGALTDSAVKALFEAQSTETVEPVD